MRGCARAAAHIKGQAGAAGGHHQPEAGLSLTHTEALCSRRHGQQREEDEGMFYGPHRAGLASTGEELRPVWPP